MATEIEQDEFIAALAEYLVRDQAKMSILLSMHDSSAQVWARLRNATPLFGYLTVEEAIPQLRKFLFNRG